MLVILVFIVLKAICNIMFIESKKENLIVRHSTLFRCIYFDTTPIASASGDCTYDCDPPLQMSIRAQVRVSFLHLDKVNAMHDELRDCQQESREGLVLVTVLGN